MYRFILSLLYIVLMSPYIAAGTYTVAKGKTIKVPCSATPPAGYITHAFYELVDHDDAKYLGISYTSSDMAVTYYGLAPKSGIKVEVTYAYSYRGSFDGNMHVGHGSYYDYITVKGAPNLTGVKIREGSSITIRPNQTITLHGDPIPSNADGVRDWGWIMSPGKPYCFSLKTNSDGSEAYVTGLKEGTAYLLCMLPDDQTTAQTITVKCAQNTTTIEPTALKIEPSLLSIELKHTETLRPVFTPENSYADVTWSSSNEEVAKVSASGKVTAVNIGEASITATANGLTAQTTIKVIPTLTDFTIPSHVTVNLGYTYPIDINFFPSGATGQIVWSSKNSDIISISSTGVIKGKAEGTTTINAKNSTLSLSRESNATVVRPTQEHDYRNAAIRVRIIKELANEAFITK